MESNMVSAIVFLYFSQESYLHTVCEYISSARYYYCPILNECCYLNGKWKCIDTVEIMGNGGYENLPSCENYKRKPTLSRGPSRYISRKTGYTINTYSTENSDETISSGTIVAIVISLVFIISCCMSCCRCYVRNKNAKKLKIIRIQQSRTIRPTNEQSQYRIMGLYHDNGNSAAFISYPKTQDGCRNGGERLDISTLENDNEAYLPDDTTYTPNVNPPAYQDIINRNAAAIVSVNPRTHTAVDEERLANSTINIGAVFNLSDHTTSIPKVNQHTPIL